ncbi:hypothetical protein [Mycobacterium sp. IS-1496]|uniref:hypothetical protein n=1 Tax=Mycobacterium sp. IS-1496 TaxID=1772284 RepID=UPI000A4DFE65|nr:hypothetical protein [Mycobacterium sp. IS-1496]
MYGHFTQPPDAVIERFARGIRRSLEAPIVGDVMGFVWESIFAYGLGIPFERASKKLFDVVSAGDGRGWSLKTIESSSYRPGSRVEYVVQRADIYSKGVELGFRGGLTTNSPTDALGDALVEHWNRKHRADSAKQAVTQPHIAVLIKAPSRKRFTYVEATYPEWDANDLEWRWSAPDLRGREHVGLTAFRGEQPVARWHPSGTQLFEILTLPNEAVTFDVDWTVDNLAEWFEREE